MKGRVDRMDTLIALLPLLISAGFAWVAWYLASQRGRRPVLWAVLGFVFWFFALIVLVVLPNLSDQ